MALSGDRTLMAAGDMLMQPGMPPALRAAEVFAQVLRHVIEPLGGW